MALKHFIKVNSSTDHVLEIHSFDDAGDIPEGLTEVGENPHLYRDSIDPNCIILWTSAGGFSCTDIESDYACRSRT